MTIWMQNPCPRFASVMLFDADVRPFNRENCHQDEFHRSDKLSVRPACTHG